MANPFVKGWKYLMARFGAKIDEYADPKVQIQQAIEDAQRQHQALVQQAASVIGNQRQLELKLYRQLTETENYQASARQALIRKPPHILVTTPESLYLLLTSERGRELLRTVRTVIVDEIHALARDKWPCSYQSP